MKLAHPGMVVEVALHTRTQRAYKGLKAQKGTPQDILSSTTLPPSHPLLTAACQEVNSGQCPALLTAGVEGLAQSQLESPCQGHSDLSDKASHITPAASSRSSAGSYLACPFKVINTIH